MVDQTQHSVLGWCRFLNYAMKKAETFVLPSHERFADRTAEVEEVKGLWTRMMEKVIRCLRIKNETVRQGLAETLSTFLLMVFGLGSVAQVVLGKKEFGQYLSINLGFGFGVMLGVHAAGGISGAHMNASITFANCVIGQLPWRKFPAYVLGQFLGSFLAAAAVFAMYYEALMNFTGGNLSTTGPKATAGIFSTYPAPYMSLLGGFFQEFIATTLLLIGILAINDKKNAPALHGTHALITGLLVVVVGMSMGMNTGYAINPSRDLPPRIFTAMAGWGLQVFKAGNCWWWVPIIAPTLGSLFGMFIYNIFIDFHNRLLAEDSDTTKEEVIDQKLSMQEPV